MALFGPINRAIANISRAGLAQVSHVVETLTGQAGGVLTGLFFRLVNASVPILTQLGFGREARRAATAAVRYEREVRAAAAALQREHEQGGAPAVIPVDPHLGPGEFRLLAVTEVELPGNKYTGPVFLSVRSHGIPGAAEVQQAFIEQLAEFAADYNVEILPRHILSLPRYLRVEGGG